MKHKRAKEIAKEHIGVIPVKNDIVCIGCVFSKGSTPFDDTPYKACCEIYSNDNGKTKPNEVYFEGKSCKYRREEGMR